MTYSERLQKGIDEMNRKRMELGRKILKENPDLNPTEFEEILEREWENMYKIN